jgi:hypothetical protein
VCEAAVAGYNGALYFSNTADKAHRANLTVRRTAPGAAPTAGEAGTHVVAGGVVWGGYSSLAPSPLAAGVGGILFERNNSEGNVISFATFPLDF